MRVTVKKWGNSASVRIPAAVMVDVREEDGLIIIEPVRQAEYDLDQLIEGVTSENMHSEADFGTAVGKESF
jgi:antitoxin MazE